MKKLKPFMVQNRKVYIILSLQHIRAWNTISHVPSMGSNEWQLVTNTTRNWMSGNLFRCSLREKKSLCYVASFRAYSGFISLCPRLVCFSYWESPFVKLRLKEIIFESHKFITKPAQQAFRLTEMTNLSDRSSLASSTVTRVSVKFISYTTAST